MAWTDLSKSKLFEHIASSPLKGRRVPVNTLEVVKRLIVPLYQYAKEQLGFEEDIGDVIFEDGDDDETSNATLGVVLGPTGGYNPNTKNIHLYISGRHPKDVLRSFSHELVHHKQFESKELADEDMYEISPGYAQSNKKLRAAEAEDFHKGNMIFRDWEDSMKKAYQEDNFKDDDMENDFDGDVYKGILSLDKMRSQTLQLGRLETDINLFHRRMIEVLGAIFETAGLSMTSSEPGYNYIFNNDKAKLALYIFGLNGLPSQFNKYGTTEDSDLIVKMEWAEPDKEQRIQAILERPYKNFVAMIKEIMPLFKEGESPNESKKA
jgi:hypothetical protein